jgi:hypothetical protein
MHFGHRRFAKKKAQIGAGEIEPSAAAGDHDLAVIGLGVITEDGQPKATFAMLCSVTGAGRTPSLTEDRADVFEKIDMRRIGLRDGHRDRQRFPLHLRDQLRRTAR